MGNRLPDKRAVTPVPQRLAWVEGEEQDPHLPPPERLIAWGQDDHLVASGSRPGGWDSSRDGRQA